MANEVELNEVLGNKEVATQYMRVYKKKSTYKGAGENDFYYSATNKDGDSVIIKFKCAVESDSNAFQITKMFGSYTKKVVTKQIDGELKTFTNWTYYITKCEFSEIEGEELPF